MQIIAKPQHDSPLDLASMARAECYEAIDHLRIALDYSENLIAVAQHLQAAVMSTVRAVEALPPAARAP